MDFGGNITAVVALLFVMDATAGSDFTVEPKRFLRAGLAGVVVHILLPPRIAIDNGDCCKAKQNNMTN